MSSLTAAPAKTVPPPAAGRRSVLHASVMLRVEGGVLLAAAVIAYAQMGRSWWVFAGLLLVPDVGLLGYLAGHRVGATTYNLTHTLSLPLLLGAVALAAGNTMWGAVALIWLAHIGVDRAFGYGLKYPTSFRDTHLQRAA